MISAFFGNIFGTDTDSTANITEEVQPVAEVTQETDDEEDGITTFISDLFSSADNSTVEEIINNSTQQEEDGIMDFFSSFIWDDEKNNKTLSANVTA